MLIMHTQEPQNRSEIAITVAVGKDHLLNTFIERCKISFDNESDVTWWDGKKFISIPAAEAKKNYAKEQLLAYASREVEMCRTGATLHYEPRKKLQKFIIENFTGEFTEEFKDDFYKELVWASIPSNAINPREITYDILPSDNSYRDAWEAHPTELKIRVNHEKSRDIEIDRLLILKKVLLKNQAIAFADMGNEDREEVLNEFQSKRRLIEDAITKLKGLEAKGYASESDLDVIKAKGLLPFTFEDLEVS